MTKSRQAILFLLLITAGMAQAQNDAVPRSLELAAGGVERVEAPLLSRPLLDVSLVLPQRVREEPFTLAVRSRPAGDELARVDLERSAGRHRFVDGLVAGPAEVVLETHLGTFRRRVELVAGEEAFLALEPELIELYGEVRRGGEPHAATIVFRTVAGDTVEAVADDAGAYEAVSLQPLALVEVRLDGVGREPWQDFFMPPLAASRQLDFDLSDAEIAVRVVDAATGRPLPGAEVGVKAHYERSGDEAADEGGARNRSRAMARSHTADGDGVVLLPPPRPGRLEIHASAPGYRPLDPPRMVEVPDPPRDEEIVVELSPEG